MAVSHGCTGKLITRVVIATGPGRALVQVFWAFIATFTLVEPTRRPAGQPG